MSDINGKYKQIMVDIEENIKDPETLEFVKDKVSELSMLFIDMMERVTRLTDSKIQDLEQKQQEILTKVNSVQSIVDGIESDIYEEDEGYEFEIVCPYCNYEFTADIEDESKEEIQCPECHNTIELDWNMEDDGGCSGSCSHCATDCSSKPHLEDDDDDNIDDIIEKSKPDDEEDM